MFLGLLPLLTLPAYRQPTAPIADRVSDLVARMTPQEKARQLDMYAGAPLVQEKVDNTHAKPGTHASEPALEKALGNLGAGSIHDLYPQPALANEIQKWVIAHNRLGIPALFIEEGVHGYCGLNKTIFPCSINLAATFDTDLAGETAAAIAQEARADGVDMLLGPVLDVARDPRWGRVEEDFGEDPYLSGALGAAYVKAMQGESLDSDHSVISEPKHFAGHGEPESGLNAGPVHAGEREVRSVLLKSFQPAVEESHAKGIMAAYHDIDGVPCAGNAWLLTDVLRKEWGFQGFVLSDLGAIRELYDRHRVAPTQQDAILLALSSGVDMQFYDFDHNTYQNAIVDGVKTGKIPMSTLDRAVSRVLRMKFALGLFDHPFVDPTLTDQVNRSQIHLRVALDSARESMCLLKNEGNLLPLSKDLASIAVIGPNAATARMGDYTVTPQVAPPSIRDK
ncbi:MAG TPA: glycoside hydrolase family 3 N-terminal domain-containing protein, partial [Fimbriimonas sp.]|nr:glycoside hydrolase family 3 N-terminal domain-containing protein [Fimbriimonas sp.]